MQLKITVIAENDVKKRYLLAEHGLSLLVKIGNYQLLFDTGQGLAIESNVRAMQLDLTKINAMALSHGHYDHTGGLKRALALSGPKPIYAHPGVFDDKYSTNREGEHKSVGIPFSKKELEMLGAEFHLQSTPIHLGSDIILSGQIPRTTDFEEINDRFVIKKDGKYEVDPLLDDQALFIKTAKGVVVIVGCSHSGIINILKYARQLTGEEDIYAVVGGTHLVEANEERLHRTIEELRAMKVEKLAVSHCTGFQAQVKLKETFGHGFVLNNVGNSICI
ncbi:beta-lactamase domain protein [Desulforamulus reducens MI-1]|uniref:Beta-lactamase domain protein n=1 Tax=Desulforamulus reducens (strain ATCC BAA-1160 / DSM 100696 / MI-1) TaxID=349161 RepID=A4J4G1_DESRM|nr:MBL fold metallo-hydrolase [Desulforamulus reducens]ABO49964.1 beta-lactamase domain protein [Desulforamulus reducens MI-1]